MDPVVALSPGADRFIAKALLKKSRYKLVTLVEEVSSRQPRVARRLRQPPGATEVGLLEGINRVAQTLKTVSCPGVPRFDKVVEGQGGTWMLFEYEPGTALSQYMGMESQIPTAWILWWFQEMVRTLGTLHAHGPPLYVGFLEPSDVVVRNHLVFVVDLGLFENVFPEMGALSHQVYFNFIAPEKRTSPVASPQADLFSTAALAFWLLTGYAPVVSSAGSGPPLLEALGSYRPDLPGPAADLLTRMLAYYPSQRPASAQEVLAGLSLYVQDMAGQTLPTPAEGESSLAVAESTRPMVEERAPPPLSMETLAVRPMPPPSEPPPSRQAVVGLTVMLALCGAGVWWAWKRPSHHILATPVRTGLPLDVQVISGRLIQPLPAPGAVQLVRRVPADATLLAVGNMDVHLTFHQSQVWLGPGSTMVGQKYEGQRFSMGFAGGSLRTVTGSGDSLEVTLPDNSVVDVTANSEVRITLGPVDRVRCARGQASLQHGGTVQKLEPGQTVTLHG